MVIQFLSITLKVVLDMLSTQNQLITVCGKIIQSSILQEICAASLFSIMANEATDASNKEHFDVPIAGKFGGGKIWRIVRDSSN